MIDSNERSPAWGAAAFTALGTGVGVGMYRSYPQLKDTALKNADIYKDLFAKRSDIIQQAKSNTAFTKDTITDIYNDYKKNNKNILPTLMEAKDAINEGMGKNLEGIKDTLRRSGKKAGLFKKALSKSRTPIIAGAAIAAGIMMAAPSISGSIGTREGVNGGRMMKPESLGVPDGMSMNAPPPRIMASPKAYDMSGIKTSSHAKIKMSMSDAESSSGTLMQQARMLSQSGNTKITTRDDRSALSPQRLANKIQERL